MALNLGPLNTIVDTFRAANKSPNIAKAFDEVGKLLQQLDARLAAAEASLDRAWTTLNDHEARVDALEGGEEPPPPPSGYTVTQSVQAGQTLSGDVEWTATPSDVAATAKVEFKIDGTLRGTEGASPYVFGGDGATLDTNTLTNGQHSLAATATATDGRTATVTATVTVDNATVPPPPTGGEPTFAQPYLASSVWNTPVPANPPIHADSASIISWMVANTNPWGPTLNSVPSVYEAVAGTPTVRVQVNSPAGVWWQDGVPIRPTWKGGNGGHASPADAEPTMIIRAENGDEYSMFKVTEPGKAPLSSGGGPFPAYSGWQCTRLEKDTWKGSGTGKSYRGSGTLGGTGCIRAEETLRPAGSDYGHAISMAYPRTRAGSYMPPATTSDGTATGTSSIPMGARFWLPPGYDIEGSGLREWQKALLRTIRKYGCVVVDTGDGLMAEGLASVRERGLRFRWEDDGGWLVLPSSVIANFKVLG